MFIKYFVSVLLVGFVGVSSVYCAQYTVKTAYLGQTRYDLANAAETAPLRDALLSTSNFGSGGIVDDVVFSSITSSTVFDESSLAGADIFVAVFAEGSSRTITETEALNLKNFVNSGKSLFVIADYDNNSLASANRVGSYFGGVSFSRYGASPTTITDTVSFPDITNGPFGTVNGFSWDSNSTAFIQTAGDSTIIDSNSLFSIIAPTATNGSVIFFHDPANIMWFWPSGDIEPLTLNMFNYAAGGIQGSTTAVPEPASIVLVLSGVSILLKRFRR